VDSLALNGIHARVVAAGFVRLQMVRVLHTYDLLITRHTLSAVAGRSRPALQNSIIFFGRQGTLELELWGKDGDLRGQLMPGFLTRAGEPASIPEDFHDMVRRAVAGVTCMGCRHAHLLVPPVNSVDQTEGSVYVEAGT
jgi:hypothetical protein